MYYSQALLLFEVNLYLVWMPSPHESCMPVRQNVSNDRPHWLVLYKLKTTTKHTYNVLFAAVHLVKQFKFNSNAWIYIHFVQLCQLSMCKICHLHPSCHPIIQATWFIWDVTIDAGNAWQIGHNSPNDFFSWTRTAPWLCCLDQSDLIGQ